jgi:hypothetical protein
MKQIESVTIWNNGQEKQANILNAYIINDNLETSCTFYYQLCEGGQGTEEMPIIQGSTLADGNVTLTGENYLGWDGSNDYAFTYIAEKLNLTLIQDS